MTSTPLRLYALVMVAATLFASLSVDWSQVLLLGSHIPGLALFVLLTLASDYLAVSLVVSKKADRSSVTFILFFASILLFGPVGTVVIALTSGVISNLLVRRAGLFARLYNISQYVLSTVLAGHVYSLLGGFHNPDNLEVRLVPFVAFGLSATFFTLSAFSVAVALRDSTPLRKVFVRFVGPMGSNLLVDLLVSPFGILVALFYVQFGFWGLGLAIFPLLTIRQLYVSRQGLREANQNLVKALVKAIETRDPYTSGHSMRVSRLSTMIAEALGLTAHKVDTVATAAMLHDIGKIDIVYEQILRKAGGLSLEERRVIESHVTKGVELLQSLSSFNKEVVEAVKYHHERMDGRGYPYRIRGDHIPTGARIIMISDAIDAMLSDRPYRRGLTIDAVKSQLRRFSGTQFDSEIVETVFRQSVLEKYLADSLGGSPDVDVRLSPTRPKSMTESPAPVIDLA